MARPYFYSVSGVAMQVELVWVGIIYLPTVLIECLTVLLEYDDFIPVIGHTKSVFRKAGYISWTGTCPYRPNLGYATVLILSLGRFSCPSKKVIWPRKTTKVRSQ